MDTLRLMQVVEGGSYRVEVTVAGSGGERSATARFEWELTARDREDIRWYLEDYLLYPIAPAPRIAGRVEARIAEIGRELFTKVFLGSLDTIRVWHAVADRLAEVRVEVMTSVEGATAIPWELLRDPTSDAVVALRAHAFVRTDPYGPQAPLIVQAGDVLRVLLVICRPRAAADVPFRSVASHLVRLSRSAREAFQLDVLRPATFAQLARVLEAAKQARRPYYVVHFDGHGAYLDQEQLVAAASGGLGADPLRFSVLSEVREGSHGYLLFEDPATSENYQLVDGPALGRLLVEAGVPVLVLNACRSAHADLVTAPQTEDSDVHERVRAYGSLAQEVAHAGLGGVVAMRYNVYVVTAAQFVGDLYAALAEGQPLGRAVSAGRRQLNAKPHREIAFTPLPLRDWMVPIVYERAPAPLLTASTPSGLTITLSQAEAAPERARVDPGLPADPDVGFFGRDETLLALDRAFDTQPIVLLHAWAGAGKTSTAVEFARWYQLTGGLRYAGGEGQVLFTTFYNRHTPLVRVLDDLGMAFGPQFRAAGVHWDALNDEVERRRVALEVLAQVRVLWIWDNVEPVAGFPTGTPSAWTEAEQAELVDFLRDLRATKAKVLLTSRRDERGWLGDLPARVRLPAMPMAERVQLARAIADKHGSRLADVKDWRPLLEFTAGNPLTVTVLVGQALRDGLSTKAQVEAFVDQLRVGAAQVDDDLEQGRDRSLSASLSYGLEHAFSEAERAQLALLHLFQGFVNVAALCVMGGPDEWNVPEMRGLSLEAGIGLLERATEIGLLSAHGSGYYDVHPAVPWFFHQLFSHHYGSPDQPSAQRAVRAYTAAISHHGDYYWWEYEAGRPDIISLLAAEEANLLHARRLARTNGWGHLAIKAMQGLSVLYRHMGRAGEWRRLVDELIPDLVDPATGEPPPGHENEWRVLTSYRVHLALDGRDWESAQRLLQIGVERFRQWAGAALASPAETLDHDQSDRVRLLAVGVHLLGRILLDQRDIGCVQHYQEAIDLFRRIGARREEACVAFSLGNAYLSVPALRDLDQAQSWYVTSMAAQDPGDRHSRAQCVGQLGHVALKRFEDAHAGGAPSAELAGHLNAAVAAYHQALDLLPDDAVVDLAVFHHQLGIIYGKVGVLDTALEHYQRAIRYEELRENRYGAGMTKVDVAVDLASAGRLADALLYATAALRDFEQVGAAAAATIDMARELIAMIEQDLASDGGQGGPAGG